MVCGVRWWLCAAAAHSGGGVVCVMLLFLEEERGHTPLVLPLHELRLVVRLLPRRAHGRVGPLEARLVVPVRVHRPARRAGHRVAVQLNSRENYISTVSLIRRKMEGYRGENVEEAAQRLPGNQWG